MSLSETAVRKSSLFLTHSPKPAIFNCFLPGLFREQVPWAKREMKTREVGQKTASASLLHVEMLLFPVHLLRFLEFVFLKLLTQTWAMMLPPSQSFPLTYFCSICAATVLLDSAGGTAEHLPASSFPNGKRFQRLAFGENA